MVKNIFSIEKILIFNKINLRFLQVRRKLRGDGSGNVGGSLDFMSKIDLRKLEELDGLCGIEDADKIEDILSSFRL